LRVFTMISGVGPSGPASVTFSTPPPKGQPVVVNYTQGIQNLPKVKVVTMGRAIGKSTGLISTGQSTWSISTPTVKGSGNDRVYKTLTITSHHDFEAPTGTTVRYYLRMPIEQALTSNDEAIRKFAWLYQKLTEKPCSNNPSSG
jgi:hypothetical protein